MNNPPPCTEEYPSCTGYRRLSETKEDSESPTGMVGPVLEQLDSNHYSILQPGKNPIDLGSCEQAVSMFQARDDDECEVIRSDPETIFYCF